MPNKMLIDASHPEETRVVVVHGNRIEEFDFESQDKKQLKGNIYLARVTRVEPSLQAAFVEYGGNRHGFLAFSEIHPDYYQIPVADRQALLKAEAEAAEEEADEDGGDGEDRQDRGRGRRRRRSRGRERTGNESRDASSEAAENSAGGEAEATESDDEHSATDILAGRAGETEAGSDPDGGDEHAAEEAASISSSIAASVEADVVSEAVEHSDAPSASEDRGTVEELSEPHGDDHEIESVGAGDALEEFQARRKPIRRQYKIQEVIKRRQILLVQVVKEERGNKGAALTTYLSLAGRYSVLMPNTARGGGISRKITNALDRKRLKEVVQDLDVPQGMGVILRTAGESRTKAEIKRDYEYLMRLWENVRTLTLQSTAPALVYEEGSLIKRSVRDLYNKDIDEVAVSGEEGYREAKDFMRMLMPSHAKVVQPYRDSVPIFVRNGIEAQLDRMLQPQVTLKSGGYLIINQTEALVAIDVNSGRSTREHSIEETALHTNLEAAEEVARQLRLRDLAGLIVIDFIDMEENRNNRAVEKRLKDHLKNDRARIQLGRISHFGLMEMSRQRIRASVLESTMKPCSHCGGTGHVRSDSSVALLVVRAIEEFLMKDSRSHIVVKTPTATAMYVLNHKRSTLTEMEARFGVAITIEADETLGSQHHAIFRGVIAEKPLTPLAAPSAPIVEPDEDEDPLIEEEAEEEVLQASPEPSPREHVQPAGDGEPRGDRKRRKRRRRRGGRDRERENNGQPHAGAADGDAIRAPSQDDDEAEESGTEIETVALEVVAEASTQKDDADRKKRRRGKRGGRRNKGDEGVAGDEDGSVEATAEAGVTETIEIAAVPETTEAAEEPPAKAPRKRRATTKKAANDDTPTPDATPDVKKPSKRAPRKKVAAAETVEAEAITAEAEPVAEAKREPAKPPLVEAVRKAQPVAAEPDKPKKAGWWQRKGFF